MLRALLIPACLAFCASTPLVAQDVIEPHRITVEMVRGIRSSTELPTEELIAARRALAAGQRISTAQLRQLADIGDGFAALRFAQWLDRQGDRVPAADVAHYYGVAAATGRGGAIANLIKALDRIPADELGPRRANVFKNVILTYARAGNSYAIDAVFRYHSQSTPFGPLDDELARIVERAGGDAAAELALQLAVILLRDPAMTEDDLEQVDWHLQTALTSSSLTTQVTAQNLIPVLNDARRGLETARLEVTQ